MWYNEFEELDPRCTSILREYQATAQMGVGEAVCAEEGGVAWPEGATGAGGGIEWWGNAVLRWSGFGGTLGSTWNGRRL
jgi:hypothetical protein